MSKYDKYNFEYLKEPFEKWFWEKQENDWFYGNDFDQNLLTELNISENELIKNYIDPFNGLSIPQIQNILNYLANFLQKESRNPFKFKIELTTSTLNNALTWTVIFIKDLNLFNIDDPWINHHHYLFEPVNQCRVCGKPDFYTIGKKEFKFNKKSRYCHKIKCEDLSNSSYTNHKTCCYGKLSKDRHDLKQRFSYEKDKDKNIEYFIKFCNEKLEEKLENKYPPQIYEPQKDAEGNLIMEFKNAKHVNDWGPKIIPIEKYL